jgi:SAM-dependent methyltransferase
VKGYDDQTYGEAFAEVYDDWYGEVSDVAATVALVSDLAGDGGAVLELGVGTGRLAIPLAEAGLAVTGVDSSAAMLQRLGAKPGGDLVVAVLGDMVHDAPPGPFSVILVAYNTFFNLPTAQRQHEAMAQLADRLHPGGHLVIEAFVPDDPAPSGSQISLRSMATDRVVLSVSVDDPIGQRAEGHLIEFTEGHGVRLRPWSIRWARPGELDEMAAAAGLRVVHRWADVTRAPFGEDSTRHVSVYRHHP